MERVVWTDALFIYKKNVYWIRDPSSNKSFGGQKILYYGIISTTKFRFLNLKSRSLFRKSNKMMKEHIGMHKKNLIILQEALNKALVTHISFNVFLLSCIVFIYTLFMPHMQLFTVQKNLRLQFCCL